MQLAYDVLGFELQFSCHHVVVLGDLNYRVALPADDAIRMMVAGEWDTLRSADELSRAMAQGQVLSGFSEAPIRFLPSYRRVVGEAGRLTERELLQAAAGGGVDTEVLQRGFTTHLKGTERTPSYTDRVLTCSLPDLAPSLICERYLSEETIVQSDHRPVAAELTLNTWRPHTIAAAPARGSATVRCRLWLHDLSYLPLSSSDSAPSAVHVAFPMPAEDPSFALNRVAWLFGRPANSAYERVAWGAATATEHGVSLTAEVDCSAVKSVHALVHVVDSAGATLGQGAVVVPLPWLQPPGTLANGDAEGGVPFEASLLHRGQRVGSLNGVASALWLCGKVGAPPAAEASTDQV